jgi:hypothetical protein
VKESSSLVFFKDEEKFEAKFAALGVGLLAVVLLFFIFFLFSFYCLSNWNVIPDCVIEQARNLLCSQSYVLQLD